MTGQTANHTGIDVYNSEGGNALVMAVADGYVKSARDGVYWSYADNPSLAKTNLYAGNYVLLTHNINGIEYDTFYAHLKVNSVAVRAGQEVTTGQTIGIMGQSGKSTGIHLHFEVRIQGDQVNPGSLFLNNGCIEPFMQ